ncbi:PAS domain-containing protein [Chondromyces apiculatus]|uniref:RsbR, positive regulator of sigma-B n=1 Tax=Chondromyces apiculatus DSM 436 TaxID=1192034 RepID=A0A017SX98_9BACT|nr:PAS domain-containing protein [Chondromyces apiculatus]EYF01402.1 RsbR, positive regulator of sigma-B [Chondromyces apiculatus DSM 436]
MHVALNIFPEPVAILDSHLEFREMNALWREALAPAGGAPLAPAVRTAVRAVLEGKLERTEVEAAAPPEGDARYRFTVVAIPGTEALALLHARALPALPALPATAAVSPVSSAPHACGAATVRGEGDEVARAQALAEENHVLRAVIDTMPSAIFVKDRHGRFVVVNKAYAALHGSTVEEVLRKSQREVHESEESEGYLRADAEVIRSGLAKTMLDVFTPRGGEPRYLQVTKQPVVRRSGEVQVLGFASDITEKHLAELARDEALRELSAAVEGARREAEEKAALASELDRRLAEIQAQNEEILTLSAPILEMDASTVGVPLLGALDEARAATLTERLLRAVVARKARDVILDLTGIEAVDENTAGRLVGIVRALGLLGARAVVTGIRPAVAQTLVALGGDLSGIRTQQTPGAALRMLAQMRR